LLICGYLHLNDSEQGLAGVEGGVGGRQDFTDAEEENVEDGGEDYPDAKEGLEGDRCDSLCLVNTEETLAGFKVVQLHSADAEEGLAGVSDVLPLADTEKDFDQARL